MNDNSKRRQKAALKHIHQQTKERKAKRDRERAAMIAAGPESPKERPSEWRRMNRAERRLWKMVAKFRAEAKAKADAEAKAAAEAKPEPAAS